MVRLRRRVAGPDGALIDPVAQQTNLLDAQRMIARRHALLRIGRDNPADQLALAAIAGNDGGQARVGRLQRGLAAGQQQPTAAFFRTVAAIAVFSEDGKDLSAEIDFDDKGAVVLLNSGRRCCLRDR